MMNMQNNGSELMYDMFDSSKRLRQCFINGVHESVWKTMEQAWYTQDSGIRCTWIRWVCEKILKPLKPFYVRVHLLQYDFKPKYI